MNMCIINLIKEEMCANLRDKTQVTCKLNTLCMAVIKM